MEFISRSATITEEDMLGSGSGSENIGVGGEVRKGLLPPTPTTSTATDCCELELDCDEEFFRLCAYPPQTQPTPSVSEEKEKIAAESVEETAQDSPSKKRKKFVAVRRRRLSHKENEGSPTSRNRAASKGNTPTSRTTPNGKTPTPSRFWISPKNRSSPSETWEERKIKSRSRMLKSIRMHAINLDDANAQDGTSAGPTTAATPTSTLRPTSGTKGTLKMKLVPSSPRLERFRRAVKEAEAHHQPPKYKSLDDEEAQMNQAFKPAPKQEEKEEIYVQVLDSTSAVPQDTTLPASSKPRRSSLFGLIFSKKKKNPDNVGNQEAQKKKKKKRGSLGLFSSKHAKPVTSEAATVQQSIGHPVPVSESAPGKTKRFSLFKGSSTGKSKTTNEVAIPTTALETSKTNETPNKSRFSLFRHSKADASGVTSRLDLAIASSANVPLASATNIAKAIVDEPLVKPDDTLQTKREETRLNVPFEKQGFTTSIKEEEILEVSIPINESELLMTPSTLHREEEEEADASYASPPAVFDPLDLSGFERIIVMDNGSGTCVMGYSNETSPRADFASLVGRAKHTLALHDTEVLEDEISVGNEAQRKRGVLLLKHPIDRGIVTDWDDMERVWRHGFFNEMRVDPFQHPVLLTEAPLNPKGHRERMVQIMFEIFNVPALFVSEQAVLALHASGMQTGCVLHAGDGVTSTVPIYEGYTLPHAIRRLDDLSGRDLTLYMVRLLQESGTTFETSAEREIARLIKEGVCYVALNLEEEIVLASESTKVDKAFELPDGHVLVLGRERFMCPEALFNPSLVFSKSKGIHEILFRTIEDCDQETRRELYSSIVLSGGTCMLPGLKERLTMELHALIQRGADKRKSVRNVQVKIHVPENPRFSVWCGGALLCSQKSFQNTWMSAEEWKMFGPSLVSSKCF